MVKRLKESTGDMSFIIKGQNDTHELAQELIDKVEEILNAVDEFVPIAIDNAESDRVDPEMKAMTNAGRIYAVNKYLRKALNAFAWCDPNKLLDVDYYLKGGTD